MENIFYHIGSFVIYMVLCFFVCVGFMFFSETEIKNNNEEKD